MYGRGIVATLLLVGGLSACSQSILPAPTPTGAAAVCGTPSPTVEDPTGVTAPGNRLGPLMIVSGFADSGSPTPALIGAPTKVLIHPVEQFDQSITLTGAVAPTASRCASGTASLIRAPHS